MGANTDEIVFETDAFRFSIDSRGHALSLRRTASDTELLDPAQSVFFKLSRQNRTLELLSVSSENWGSSLDLVFDAGMPRSSEIRIKVAVHNRKEYLVFEAIEYKGLELPAVLSIQLEPAVSGMVADILAVVHGGADSVGLQGLSAFCSGSAILERACTVLRVDMPFIEGIRPGGIALFAGAGNCALDIIGRIEEGEHLPHPLVEGQWAKQSRATRQSYLVAHFAPHEIEEAVGYAEQAGLSTLYLPPWIWATGGTKWYSSFGHFGVNRNVFPRGPIDLRNLSDSASSRGITIGAHTMSAWISGDDSYVTPVPHKELASWAEGELIGDIRPDTSVLRIRLLRSLDERAISARAGWYTFNVVRVDDELIKYGEKKVENGTVSLLGCERGAYGTRAGEHGRGGSVSLLILGYDHFGPAPDSTLLLDQASQLAGVMNECNLGITSFDGLETLDYEGEWGMNRFVEAVYRGWDHHVLCDASLMNHFLWHILSRANWGENMIELRDEVERRSRLRNVAYHIRNLLPPGFGWWPLRLRSRDYEATNSDDFEYILAKCAGYDAFFCIETSIDILRRHPQTKLILDLVQKWESLRNRQVFTADQRELLKTPGLDFRLDTGKEPWTITPFKTGKPVYFRAPEKGDFVSLSFENPYSPQPLRIVMRVMHGFDADAPDSVMLLPDSADSIERSTQAGTLSMESFHGRDGDSVFRLSCDFTAPFSEIVPAGNAPMVNDRRTSPPVRMVWAASRCGGYTPFETSDLRKPFLDLSKKRGLGMWLECDSPSDGALLFIELVDSGRQVRQYYAPLDEGGRRWVEWPNGEASAHRYYDYEWARGPDCGFWQALKNFDYGRIMEVRIGMVRIPPGEAVSVRIEGLCAMGEIDEPFMKPVLTMGNRRIEFRADVCAEHYLVYEGGDTASVFDADWAFQKAYPVKGQISIPKGPYRIDVRSDCSPIPPWISVQNRCGAEPFTVVPKR